MLTTVLLLPVAVYFFVQLPAVQTFLVRQVSGILSEKAYPASVSVGSVYYSFFTSLIIDDVYVSDIKGDTLLYVNELALSLSSFNYSKKQVALRSVHLHQGVFNLYTYPLNDNENTTNMAAILEKFKNPPSEADTLSGNSWNIKVENVEVSDFRFTFRNFSNPTNNPVPQVVDYKNLDIRDIYVDARRLRTSGDTLFFELKDIRCLEKSGYRLKHLAAKRGYVCGTQTMLEEMELADNYSHLVMHYYKMDYENKKSFNRYETQVRMEADFDNALFSFRSLGYLAKYCDMQPDVYISGVVSGTVADLRSNFVQISTASTKTQLLVKLKINGLPDIKETMIDIDVIRLTTDAEDLTDLLQGILYPDALNLSALQPLTAINVIGGFTGLYNDFVAQGTLLTNLGNAGFDLSFNFDKQAQGVYLKGDAQAHKLNIGRLMDAPSLFGEVTGELTAEGKILPERLGGLQIKAMGQLSQFNFRQYDYKDIYLNGVMQGAGFDGSVAIKDPNLNLDFSGSVYQVATAHAPDALQFDFDATVHHADLVALHLNPRDSVSIVKMAVKADYEMKNTFEGTGSIAISDIEYTGRQGKQSFGGINIQSDYQGNRYHIALHSGFLEMDYMAQRPVTAFVENMDNVLARQHLPVIYDDNLPDTLTAADGRYNLKATFKNIAAVADIALPGLYIAPNTKLSVTISEDDSLNLWLTGDELAWSDYHANNISLHASGNAAQSRSEFKVGKATVLGFTMQNLASLVTLSDNKLNFQTSYDNQAASVNRGNLSATLAFTKEQATGDRLANLQVYESGIIINDTTWNIAPATVRFNKKIHVDNFHVYNHRQDIRINGALSNSLEDTLTVAVKDFDISNVNYATGKGKYYFEGLLSGEAKIVDVYHSLHFFTQITIDRLLVNNRLFGNLDVNSWWHNQDKQFLLHAAAQIDTLRTLEIDGIYSPKNKYLDLSGVFNHFQVSHVAPLLESVLSNIAGTLSGKVHLYGQLPNLVTEGSQLYAENIAATVDYLKMRYSFSSPLFIDSNSFGFKNAEAGDGLGGVATVSLTVGHTNFQDWQYEVAAYPRNLCVMNTTEKDNDIFYGRAYATGAALIKGKTDDVVFDINLKAERNSVLHIPASSSQAQNMGLLSFTPLPEDTVRDVLNSPAEKNRQLSNMDISLNLSVTPETEVLLELDKKSEDVMHSFGTGDIKMEINPSTNKFNIYGDYRVSKGDYLFTIQNFNLITKRFDFVEGGRISFNGDLQKMNLDLSAIYKTTASLSALLADSSAMATRRQVSCRIDITGNLLNPVITLGVDVENLDAETRARVQSALNTEEKRVRQFLSLLAFGGFLADDQAELSADLLMGSATGLVTSQINNLFSRFNLPLGFGFSYLPQQRGRDDVFEVSFSTQILNDRIVINGNVGSGNESQTIANDFDLGIRLDSKNKLQFRAFTRSVDRYTDNVDNSQRYGLGIMYQEEFNNFSELFERFFGKKKTTKVLPEKEPVVRNEEEHPESRKQTEPNGKQ
ncbi:MAG: translocation/assembly module TamB domain-containing protein [Prevotellaceae bacterium]|nr:translocation/assembly module TamB domain-containing protein [Prevotellaceae bacterium]